MATPNEPSQQKGLTPDGLVEQLFTLVLAQNPSDPRGAAGHVIEFLLGSLFYAVSSNKGDVVVFLTETLGKTIATASPDEASRKAMLKQVGEMFLAASADAPPAAAPAAKP
jgi:hypothetical protein